MKKIYLLFGILAFQLAYTSPLALASNLAKVGASRIIVESAIKLTNEGSIPKFSPSGNLLFYGTKEVSCGVGCRLPSQAVIIDPKSRKIIKTFACKGGLKNVVWHPDEERIAYCTHSRHLTIVDLNSGRQFQLSYPGYSCVDKMGGDRMVWHSDSEIYFRTSRGYFSFNLDDLQNYPLLMKEEIGFFNPLDKAGRQRREQKGRQRQKQKEKVDKLFSSNRHIKSYVYRKDVRYEYGGRALPSLIVAGKDHSYARVLIENVFAQHGYDVSPYLRYVAFQDTAGGLYMAYLGVREEPREFRLNLDKVKQLNTDQRGRFKKCFEGGGTIWLRVYRPKVNPLNNKVVGPDREDASLKGWIRITESYDSYSIVKTAFEIKPIEEGDIATDMMYYGKKTKFKGYFKRQKIWAVLQ